MKQLFRCLLISLGMTGAYSMTTAQTYHHHFTSKWEVSVQGGWSYRLARISPSTPVGFQEYAEALRSGYNLGAGVSRYYWKDFMGIGIQYSRFGTMGSLRNVNAMHLVTGHTVSGTIKDNIDIQFMGPTFNVRHAFGKRYSVSGYVGIGYISYTDRASLGNMKLTLKGNHIGQAIGANINLALGNKTSLYVGSSLVAGTISQMKITQAGQKTTVKLEDDDRESLRHLNTSLGVRWHL